RLYVGVRKTGTNVWSIAKTRSGSSWLPCYIDVRKSGRKYEISAETFTCGYTEAEGNAAAVLSGACGAAVQMNYSARGSSASTTNQRIGLFKYMDYDDGMTNLPFNTQSEQQFLDVIKDELSNGRIVFCCGVSEHNDAHAYNIDGMKTIDGLVYVHISWGWGGLDNGYYLLSNMAPPTQPQFGNFGYSYHLIVGVQPDDDVKNYPRFAMEKLETDKTNYKQGELLKVTLTKFYNYGCENFVGNHYIMLVDENGNMTNLGTLLSAESDTKPNYGFPSYSRGKTIPASIPDGEYTVKIFSLPTALEGDFSKAYEMACPECPVVTVGNSTAVSVTERNPEGDAAPAYYNTSGQRLSVKPASGIVIERRGNRVVKRVGRN
ncbi:MAG: C10 family peptidase, partial [Prevotella sp.]|nr:C10 family peptidase [Prevotella sp.]